MRENKVLRRLRAGKATMGLWMNSGSPLMAEMGAHAGFDWVLIDTQHGYWDYAETIAATQVISATDALPIARVARNDPQLIGRLLDMGILGIVVPLVNSPEEAAAAVDAMRYPPLGHRSVGGSRLSLYGDDYTVAANGEILAAVMIETRRAAEQAHEILSVPGVDMGFIGPVDLALSLGTFGQDSAVHEAMIQGVLRAGQDCGVPVGIYAMGLEDAVRRAEQGFQFMPCMNDLAFYQRGLTQVVSSWRAH